MCLIQISDFFVQTLSADHNSCLDQPEHFLSVGMLSLDEATRPSAFIAQNPFRKPFCGSI